MMVWLGFSTGYEKRGTFSGQDKHFSLGRFSERRWADRSNLTHPVARGSLSLLPVDVKTWELHGMKLRERPHHRHFEIELDVTTDVRH